MLNWIGRLINNSDVLTVIFTLITVVIASFKNWFIADNRLKTSYYLMISLGIAYICLNTTISLKGEGQEIVMLMNIPASWTTLMGIKGLRRLKREENETRKIREHS